MKLKLTLTLIASMLLLAVVFFTGLWFFDKLVVKPSIKFASNKLIHK